MDPLKEGAQPMNARPIYTYKVPKVMADGVQSIGLVQLTTHEEMMSAKRAGSDPIRLVYEQVKQSLAEVNGQPVSLGDGTADTAFDKMGPQLRNLVMTAYAKLHTPADGMADDFLASQAVKVA